MRISATFLLITGTSVFADLDVPSDAASDNGQAIGWLIGIAFWGLLCGAIGAAIGKRKGRGAAGFFLGALLGPIGWILVAVSQGDRLGCPQCRELVDPLAAVCPKCQSALISPAKPLQFEQWRAKFLRDNSGYEHQSTSWMKVRYDDYVTSFKPAAASGAVKSEETAPPPPRRSANNLIQVARDGEDLGRMEPQKLCDLIAAGDLTLQDHFFDPAANQWRTLNECPAIQVVEPNPGISS